MLLLPDNLAGLARLCASADTRYAMSAVRLTEHSAGYRIDVTDGRRMAIVTGPGRQAEPCPALTEAPNGAWEALIPAADWREAFRRRQRAKGEPPEAAGVHAIIGTSVTTFARGDRLVLTATHLAGRYPNIDQVAVEQASVFRIDVDAPLLAELLHAADAIASANGDSHRVTLHIQGKGKPLLLTARNLDGQQFQAALVPLS